MLTKSANLQNCFKRNIFQFMFGGFYITSVGIELRKQLQNEISQLEKLLPDLIANNAQKAQEILKSIGGNVFLLRNIDFELLNQIDKELLEEMNRQNNETNTSGCSGCHWNGPGSFSDLFDNSCHGHNDSSSNGCSGCGDSGCSGCSSSSGD